MSSENRAHVERSEPQAMDKISKQIERGEAAQDLRHTRMQSLTPLARMCAMLVRMARLTIEMAEHDLNLIGLGFDMPHGPAHYQQKYQQAVSWHDQTVARYEALYGDLPEWV